MSKDLLYWDIYEIDSKLNSLTGVMLRGRIRKFGLENDLNVLAENSEDKKGLVRFAVLFDEDISLMEDYLKRIIPDVLVRKVKSNVANPVLSKLKVNLEERYIL